MDSQQPFVGSKQPPVRSKHSFVSYQEPSVSSKQLLVGYQEPSVGRKQLLVCYQEPFVCEQEASLFSEVAGKTYQISLQQGSERQGKTGEAYKKTLYLSQALKKFKK